MNPTLNKISAGLEQAFAARGFAEPSVEDLRDAAGVSLRTLYKYLPSRQEMVLAAMEHRNLRYLSHLFDGLVEDPALALDALLDRVGQWMQSEAAHGCLFHSAVASAPADTRLRALLKDHKSEFSSRAAAACGLEGHTLELELIFEGLTQTWPLHGTESVHAAKRLGQSLMRNMSG
jgi:AcrR family transcriptional regulator